jgi:calcineurin-like phosphoesterase family protein
MPATFLVSDTHFGHAGVCRFTHPDDATVKLRPWDDPAEMDEEMIRRWNDRVRPSDKVYHLGDVVINRKSLSTLARLNGDKVLIRGNHDIFRDDEYRLVHVFASKVGENGIQPDVFYWLDQNGVPQKVETSEVTTP